MGEESEDVSQGCMTHNLINWKKIGWGRANDEEGEEMR